MEEVDHSTVRAALLEESWSIAVHVTPTSDDFKFFRVAFELHRPGSRVPIRLNTANNVDMLYERIQGDLNNLLRQLTNDLAATINARKPTVRQRTKQ
jgi:hypothetical protein